MPTPLIALGETVWELPPLILHPFNERVPPESLAENARAGLILAGLLQSDGDAAEDLKRRFLTGRHAELRMLFFVGKDALRWIGQCEECADRIGALSGIGINAQSFAGLLAGNPPAAVKEKLVHWGVADHCSIFSRAIGLNAAFAEPPAAESLAEEFLRNYHRYADALFRCYMESQPHRTISAANFTFELYASGEYSRMLEHEWGEV